MGVDFSNWQREILSPDLHICRAKFPSGHESDASEEKKIDIRHTPTCEGHNYFNSIKEFWWLPGVEFFIKKWSITQEKPIPQQLESGIRAFDFRLLYANQKFYVSHSYILGELEPVLQQIRQFMEAHPGEIIILRFKADYEHQKDMEPHHQEVADIIQSHENLGDMLIRKIQGENGYKEDLDNDEYAIGKLQQQDSRILLIYDEVPEKGAAIWNNGIYDGHWADKPNAQEVVENFKDKAGATTPSNKVFKECSAVVTPDSDSIKRETVDYFLGFKFLNSHSTYGIKNQARKVNRDMLSFFNDPKNRDYKEATTVFTFDFPSEEDISTVIEMNK